ncbi:hypothetical protein F8S13_22380 [Chloroflexia bacterium SDU3-3]|nr:hypothetical protein F8S13_22380 [Chloroflexia bacterium SDU3-3]
MATSDDIQDQQQRLRINRQTLADMLRQQAIQGSAYALPGLLATIRETRQQIARIKGILRAWGVSVENHPDDEDPMRTPSSITQAPITPSPAAGNSYHFHGTVNAGKMNLGGTETIQHEEIPMGDTYQNGDNFTGANFSGAIVNIRATLSNVTQSIGSMPHGSADDKQQLATLVEQLRKALETAPAESQEDAEAVADLAKDLLDKASKATPNKKTITISAEGLKQAAENLGAALPAILPLVPQIIQAVQKMLPA